MSPEPSVPASSESDELLKVLGITRARTLARTRRFDEALALVDSNQRIRQSAAGREFYASVLTLRGDYPSARIQWAHILAENPEHRKAKDMVEAIDVWSVRPPWLSSILAAGAIVAFVAIAGLGYILTSPAKTTKAVVNPAITEGTKAGGNSGVKSKPKPAADTQPPVIIFSLPPLAPEQAKKD